MYFFKRQSPTLYFHTNIDCHTVNVCTVHWLTLYTTIKKNYYCVTMTRKSLKYWNIDFLCPTFSFDLEISGLNKRKKLHWLTVKLRTVYNTIKVFKLFFNLTASATTHLWRWHLLFPQMLQVPDWRVCVWLSPWKLWEVAKSCFRNSVI